MWKLLMRYRLKRNLHCGAPVTIDDIKGASTILFSVFSRYGDGITSFKVINEFISLYPGKRYILITSPQLYIYAKKIIRGNIEIHFVNKRKNPIKLLGIVYFLRKAGVDLGFNPWSHGEESEFFITFAKKFFVFKKATKYPRQYNVYERVRKYLLLDLKETRLRPPAFKDGKVKKIVIAPFSTDVKKNLGRDDITRLIKQLRNKFGGPDITVALPKEELQQTANIPEQKFLLGKSAERSASFLKLLETTDLFIGVDAGPLHLADALGIKSIGIFGSNAAETFMDKDSNILPVRNKKLDGVFCFVTSCKDPLCIHELFESDIFENIVDVDFSKELLLETKKCVLKR